MYAQIGDKIKITYMKGQPNYTDKEGVVKIIDNFGQLFGTWGWFAVIPDIDEFEVIERVCDV